MGKTAAVTSNSDTSFYGKLAPIRMAAGIFDDANYVEAPADWLLAVSDIRGSTEAVAAGRHSDVNFAAAAMIAALTNLSGQFPINSAATARPPWSRPVTKKKCAACWRGCGPSPPGTSI